MLVFFESCFIYFSFFGPCLNHKNSLNTSYIIRDILKLFFPFFLHVNIAIDESMGHDDIIKLKIISSDLPSVKIHFRYSLWPSLRYHIL